MENAVHAQRARQTKILILKSITTLNDATVTRILEKSDWNLRRAIEAFYMAKYKVSQIFKNGYIFLPTHIMSFCFVLFFNLL